MPALLVDTNTRPLSSSDVSAAASPDRPPVSPITPTATLVQPPTAELPDTRPRHVPPPAAVFRPQPPSVAISESENPDAIALRSAISLLQLQREKSKRDLKALQQLKAAAVADPQAFARSIQEQQAQASQSYADALTPTLTGLVDQAENEGEPIKTERMDSAGGETDTNASKLPPIPQPQNIVRCPPVNWAKYQIVGEPLDKLHEEQKKWPGAPEPPRAKSGARAPPHVVAAPYSPFTDGLSQSPSALQPPMKGSKKSPS